MASLGETLFAARSAREETLEDVARVLRIRPVILQALENGDFASLPASAVTKGFVRTYTKYLDLDDNQAVRLYEEESGSQAGSSSLNFPEAVEPARLPGFSMLATGLLIIGFAVVSWLAYVNRDVLNIERVSELPDRLINLITGDQDDAAAPENAPAPEEEPSPAPGDTSSQGGATSLETPAAPDLAEASGGGLGSSVTPAVDSGTETAENPAPENRVPDSPDQPAPVIRFDPAGPVIAAVLPPLAGENMVSEAEQQVQRTLSDAQETPEATALVDPAPVNPDTGPAEETAALNAGEPAQAVVATPDPPFSADGTIYGEAGGAPRVVVRALGDSWVQVRNQAGRTVFSRIMRKGDVYRVPGEPGLRMIAGSVGDLEFWVDGAALSRLGDRGSVRRDIPLDADRLARLGTR